MIWTNATALWLLLAVPLVWLAHLVARTNFNPHQRRLQALVRSLLLIALAVALAGPVMSTTSSRHSIVYVVDVSHSISSQSIEAAARKIEDLNDALRPAHSRIVAFGATAAVVDETSALRRLAQTESPAADRPVIDRRGTDVQAALDAARAELAPHHVPRLVLFSDGHQTAGDVSITLAQLAGGGIPVSVEPLTPRSLGDTWIDDLVLPERIVAAAPFTVSVRVGSQREGSGVVELRSGEQVLARRAVSLSAGVIPVAVDVLVEAPGAQVLRATITVPNDPLALNNVLDREVRVHPRPKVLYIEGALASARYLSGALTQAGFDVTVRSPAGLPASAGDLDPWDVIVLSDVPRRALPDPSLTALSDWIEKSGGGLLVAGGDAVFGEGGYRRSPLERLTPVTFERRDEPEVALILVLDRSWSMAGASMELSKAAAQAAVDVLADEQSVGVLTFNDKFNWDVTLRNVGSNREAIRRKIAAIGPGGHTLIFPAVEQAYLALRSARARAKHVVLLSDGRSYPDDYETLIRKMVDARITVSSVAVGPSADPELLGNIAKWGKGRPYVVADPKEIPQIFVKEAKNALSPAFDEKEITSIVKTPAFLSGVDLSRMPQLKGRTATVLKDTALDVISTDDGDPLLAFWPVGLGRAAVFASDVKDRWAANWVRWSGYGPFFSAVVRALERQRPPAIALDVVTGPIHGQVRSVAISVEARDSDGLYRDLLRPVAQVRGNGAPANVPLRQVASGRYEGTVVVAAAELLTVTMTGAETGVTSRLVVPDPAAEYRFRPPDESLLRSIASATGGAWLATPTSLARAVADRRSEHRPVWSVFLAAALCLWLVDLLLRRVRMFEATGHTETRTFSPVRHDR